MSDHFDSTGKRSEQAKFIATSQGNARDPVMRSALPFLYGAQYYRAPTPDRRHWAGDLAAMRDAGFNTVKFWAQWRWAHRAPDRFFFDDLDELMNLAAQNDLSVTINIIFDVAPDWIYTAHSDCRMIRADGRVIEPQTAPCRQIGGYPGPCFNHPQAQKHRRDFLAELVGRYSEHPAMGMWDVWNEPETNLLLRTPQPDTLLCYCDNCRRNFLVWLERKYASIERLNRVWGRCYERWNAVELPRQPETINDMIDWRLFNLDSLAEEAQRRIACVKSLDRAHPVYLHPVPNTLDPFNSVTCADDFQLAGGCDCFAGTINGGPAGVIQTVSAAQGRVCYNVESHLRAGRTGVYPKSLTVEDFAFAFMPQIGQGVRGFLHWQYRAETLGTESPAWGLLDPDGTIGMTHRGAADFWSAIQPVADRLMTAPSPHPVAAIFKSASNELYHWCVNGNGTQLRDSIDGFTNLLYQLNVQFSYVNEGLVRGGLPQSIRLLVLPLVAALDRETAGAIADWVHQGGTLICEGLTGSFDLDTGRHNEVVPGCGLFESLGLREKDATAVRHLWASENGLLPSSSDADLLKVLQAHGSKPEEFLPLTLTNGTLLTGRHHYAEIEGESVSSLAGLSGRPPCVVHKRVGLGQVIYAGTEIGWQQQSERPSALRELLVQILHMAGIEVADTTSVTGCSARVDQIQTPDGIAIAVTNQGIRMTEFACHPSEPMIGLFAGIRLRANEPSSVRIMARQAELFVPARWLNNRDSAGDSTGKNTAVNMGAEPAAAS